MKKFILTVLLIIAALVVGRYYYYKSKVKKQKDVIQSTQETKSQLQVAMPSSVDTDSSVKTYTMEEVAKHGSDPDNYIDCWTVIHDKVYDITEFVDSLKHPGGEQIYQACGTDATVLFETRPTGSGTPHSAEARKILEKYYIGDLKNN